MNVSFKAFMLARMPRLQVSSKSSIIRSRLLSRHRWVWVRLIERYARPRELEGRAAKRATIAGWWRGPWKPCDLAGHVAETSDTDLQVGPLYTFAYDPLGRVDLARASYLPGGDRVLDSAYDHFGNRKELDLIQGAETLTHTWSFNDLDRLTEATFPGGQTLGFEYLANDNPEMVTHGNGATTTYSYLPQGPVQTITVRNSGGTQLHQLTYAVDPLSNVDTVTEEYGAGTSHAYDYGYDGANRLVSATYPTALGLPASETFEYDAAGNRELPGNPSAYAYDPNNRITASPGNTYAFDADGSLATIDPGGPDQIDLGHDFAGRLRAYSDPGAGTTWIVRSYCTALLAWTR